MENTKNVFYVIKYCCFGTDYKEEEINSFYSKLPHTKVCRF